MPSSCAALRHRRAGVGDGWHARLAEQPDVVAFEGGGEKRSRIELARVIALLVDFARQFLDLLRLQRCGERHDGVDALEIGARRLGVLADPVRDPRGGLQRAERQCVLERRLLVAPEIERRGYEVELSAGLACSQQIDSRRAQHPGRCESAAGRPARSGRRCRWRRAGRCPGPRSWRCRRSRRAVRRSDRPRSPRRSGRETPLAPAPGRAGRSRWPRRRRRQPSGKSASGRACAAAGRWRVRGRRVCRGARRQGRPPGRSRSRPPRESDARPHSPSRARGARRVRVAFRLAMGVSSTSGALDVERQAQAEHEVRGGSARSKQESLGVAWATIVRERFRLARMTREFAPGRLDVNGFAEAAAPIVRQRPASNSTSA